MASFCMNWCRLLFSNNSVNETFFFFISVVQICHFGLLLCIILAFELVPSFPTGLIECFLIYTPIFNSNCNFVNKSF